MEITLNDSSPTYDLTMICLPAPQDDLQLHRRSPRQGGSSSSGMLRGADDDERPDSEAAQTNGIDSMEEKIQMVDNVLMGRYTSLTSFVNLTP